MIVIYKIYIVFIWKGLVIEGVRKKIVLKLGNFFNFGFFLRKFNGYFLKIELFLFYYEFFVILF